MLQAGGASRTICVNGLSLEQLFPRLDPYPRYTYTDPAQQVIAAATGPTADYRDHDLSVDDLDRDLSQL